MSASPSRLEVHSTMACAIRQSPSWPACSRRQRSGSAHRNGPYRGRDKGPDLETALPGVAVNLLVGVGQHGGLILTRPAVEEITIPSLVDHAAVRRCRPVRNTARAHNGNALGGR